MVYLAFVVTSLFVIDFYLGNTQMARWGKDGEILRALLNDKYQIFTTPLLLRKGEQLSDKKIGVKRILVVGDSFIFGDGYSNSNLTWWSALYNNLLASGYDVEVVAAGYNGMSAYEEYRLIQESDLLATVDPDLIVIGWVQANDLESKGDGDVNYCGNQQKKLAAASTCTERYGQIYGSSEDTGISIFGRHTYNFLEEYLPNIEMALAERIINKYQFDKSFIDRTGGYGRQSHYEVTVSEESLDWNEKYFFKPFSEFINTTDIPYFYVITDVLPPDGTDPHVAEVLKYFDKYNINYYDFSEYAAKLPKLKDSTKYYINPSGSHPSHFTTSFYAQHVQQILESEYPNILGKKRAFIPYVNINDATPWNIDLKKISEDKYTFVYPDPEIDSGFLHMPVGKQFIKLSLQFPIDIKSMKISGDGLVKVEVWLSSLNKDGWDDMTRVVPLGAQKEGFVWSIDEPNITSFNIHAEFREGASRELVLELFE